MPSSARALDSGPASRARPATTFAASSSASAFASSSSPQTKASSSGRPRELAGGEGVEAGDHRASQEVLRALSERERVGRAKIAGDAQDGCRADRFREGGRSGDRGVGLRREDDEIHAADRFFVRRAWRRTDLARLLPCALRVAGADHDLVARLHETAREREPEVTRAADDRDPHAGTAPNAVSARRRRASASLMSVRVTIGRTSPRLSRSSASASSTMSASTRPG